jgi:hypothetical protein
MKYRHLPLLVILLALSMPAYSASIVFSNFGFPPFVYLNTGNNVIGPGAPANVTGADLVQAVAFMTPSAPPSQLLMLMQIDVGLAANSGLGCCGPFTLSLDSSSTIPGPTPGSIQMAPDGTIESWTLPQAPVFGTTTNTVQTVMPVSPVSLGSDTQYWLVVSPTPGVSGIWMASPSDFTSPALMSINGGLTYLGSPRRPIPRSL